MASRYWVGGTGTWNGTNTTNWSATSGGAGGASVPTTADDVFFNASSGTGTVTIQTNYSPAILTLDCTGYTGTIANTGGNSWQFYGTLFRLAAGMTWTSASESLTAGGSSLTATLDLAGKTIGNYLIVNGIGLTLQLGSALTVTGGILHSQGTLTTTASNYSMTIGSYSGSQSAGATVLTLNASTVTITGASGWSCDSLMTLNAGTSTINLSSNNTSFSGGGKTYRNVAFTNTTPSGLSFINDANTFNQLTFTAPATVGVSEYGIAANQTITTMVCSGASAVQRICLLTWISGGTPTLTITNWTTIADIDFFGIALNSLRSGTRLGNCGSNTNITFPAAKTVYWNLAGTNSWGATGWATSSGGVPALNNFPLPQDTAVIDNTSAGTQINLDSYWNLGTINASTRTTAFNINFTSGPTIAGDWINGSGITTSSNGVLYWLKTGTQLLTTAGKTFACGQTIYWPLTTLSLQDALTCSKSGNAIDNTYGGTLTTNGNNVTLTAGNFLNSGTVSAGASTISVAGSGSTAFTNSGTVTGSGTISMTSASAKTFAGGSKSYSTITLNQGGAGALTITGSNSFGNITASYTATGACSILFTAATTSTFSNWNASGTVGKLLTIGSVTAASHTLSKSSGTVSADYLSISRSTATGGATWYAGANSTDGGNNTGWIFSAAPPPSTGNFLMFFM